MPLLTSKALYRVDLGQVVSPLDFLQDSRLLLSKKPQMRSGGFARNRCCRNHVPRASQRKAVQHTSLPQELPTVEKTCSGSVDVSMGDNFV